MLREQERCAPCEVRIHRVAENHRDSHRRAAMMKGRDITRFHDFGRANQAPP